MNGQDTNFDAANTDKRTASHTSCTQSMSRQPPVQDTGSGFRVKDYTHLDQPRKRLVFRKQGRRQPCGQGPDVSALHFELIRTA